MMTKNADKKREQMMMFSMDDMVPQNHMLRLIDKAINWNFIYDLVEEKYCPDNGRPSMDPVMLIKIPFIQYLYGIKSMRQTMKEIEVNVAYRWFLGLDMLDSVPHFSTFGKNYTCRFKDTDLFEHIFSKILEKSTDGNESRAYLCMHESEKTGKDPGKTRLEHSQIFVDFEENKKKRSFKRKMVLGITPNTKFVYSLRQPDIFGLSVIGLRKDMRQEIQSFFAAYLFLYHFVYILKNPVHVQGFISWLY